MEAARMTSEMRVTYTGKPWADVRARWPSAVCFWLVPLCSEHASRCKRAPLCPILSHPTDCSPQAPVSVGFRARRVDWVAISSCRGSSWPGDWTLVFYVSRTGSPILYHCVPWEAARKYAKGLQWIISFTLKANLWGGLRYFHTFHRLETGDSLEFMETPQPGLVPCQSRRAQQTQQPLWRPRPGHQLPREVGPWGRGGEPSRVGER